MDRAMQGGIDDVGIGALFGLYDYKYDFVGLLMHAKHLEDTFGVGPHTISVPRIRPADEVDLKEYSNAVPDKIFEKIVAILRLAVPYTGIIMSTRESEKTRAECLKLGVSQISGGSSTSVGGYVEKEKENTAQFEVNDTRKLDEIVNWLMQLGYLPSFCTACYREGRTGDRFMRLVKSGAIANVCQPNAILTFMEYLMDYASPETREIGEKAIKNHLEMITDTRIKQRTMDELKKIQEGSRDLYF
jgi:2-iminoacetate synthase